MQDHEVSSGSGPHWAKKDLAQEATMSLLTSIITGTLIAIFSGGIAAVALSPWIDISWWRAALLVIAFRVSTGKA